MAKKRMSHTSARPIFWLSLALTAVGAYLYAFVFPYQFSNQKPIDAQTVLSEYDTTTQQQGTWHGDTVYSYALPEYAKATQVLGDSDGAEKRIEVDLTNQRLYAYEGNQQVYNFLISSGKWGRTPTGTFHIWIKLRATKMEGGNKALNTYYYLPNVPYTMFFANEDIPRWRGFGIHGTYWHENFGHPMSHGCINMKTEEAELIYYWAQPNLPDGKKSVSATEENPGTPVIIYGEAPRS